MPIDPTPLTSKDLPTIKSGSSNKKTQIAFELTEPKYSISDLILPLMTKNELIRAIGLRKYQKSIYEDWGFDKTHKYDKKMIVNMYGPPGTGKTMAAHAIANSLNKKLLLVNYADIESKYVGDTPKNIHATFKFAKDNEAILFFDEADAILSRRVTNMTSSTDTSVNQTRSVMLTLLNDYNDIVIFATNFISNYDPAFMRRILIHIEFPLPDKETRYALFKHYIPEKLPHNINLDEAVAAAEGLSGSDIANSILLSAFSTKVDEKESVSNDYLLDKIESIKKSKRSNEQHEEIISKKYVSEDFVKSQLKEVKS